MKILEAEDKIKKWIENHRFKWILIVCGLGISFGFFGNFLYGGGFRQGIIMAGIYGCFLPIVELIMGGVGS